MWFLQTDTLLAVIAFSLALGLLRKALPARAIAVISPLASLAVIAWISPSLALFSALYALAGLALAMVLERMSQGKKPCFPFFCLLAILPFLLSRAPALGLELKLPFETVGLTFQMLKVIDVFYYVYYGGEGVKPAAYFGYLFYLPVFTAGPLFRYRDYLRAGEKPLTLDVAELTADVKRIIRGLFKKVVLCRLAVEAMTFLTGQTLRLHLCLLIVAVSWLILWLDLSGYSDVAIALGRLGGLDTPENFKKPLLAPSFTQFWRSWHATLSDWIREHIYVVVAKKKLSRKVSAAIAFSTMVVMALWHGFNLPYLLAGCYNGALLALENLLGLTTVSRKKTKKSVLFLRCVLVNFLFGLNTLVFTLPAETVPAVLRGFLTL